MAEQTIPGPVHTGERLTPTDAVLACAAASSRTEMREARLAMVGAGEPMISDLDRSTLIAGDGTAGKELLGGTGLSWADSCAARSSRIQDRLHLALADQVRGIR